MKPSILRLVGAEPPSCLLQRVPNFQPTDWGHTSEDLRGPDNCLEPWGASGQDQGAVICSPQSPDSPRLDDERHEPERMNGLLFDTCRPPTQITTCQTEK